MDSTVVPRGVWSYNLQRLPSQRRRRGSQQRLHRGVTTVPPPGTWVSLVLRRAFPGDWPLTGRTRTIETCSLVVACTLVCRKGVTGEHTDVGKKVRTDGQGHLDSKRSQRWTEFVKLPVNSDGGKVNLNPTSHNPLLVHDSKIKQR